MSEFEDACRGFEEDLSAFVDGELDADRAAPLRAHVASCATCTARLDRLHAADAALRALATASASRETERVAALQRGLASQLTSESNATPRATRPHTRRGPRRARRWLTPFAVGAIAGAAASAWLLLAQPQTATPLDPPAPSVAQRALPDAIEAAKVRVATQATADAFADRGASAPAEAPTPAIGDRELIEQLDLVERLDALSPAERSALDAALARWRALGSQQRERLRAQRDAAGLAPAAESTGAP